MSDSYPSEAELDALEIAPGLRWRDVDLATGWMENEAWNDGMTACVKRLRAGLDAAARAAMSKP